MLGVNLVRVSPTQIHSNMIAPVKKNQFNNSQCCFISFDNGYAYSEPQSTHQAITFSKATIHLICKIE